MAMRVSMTMIVRVSMIVAGMRVGVMHYAENAKHHADAVTAALG